jgi:hypothetical protein
MVFLVAMSRLESNHTGTRAHLQWINVAQDAFCQCAMGIIQSTMGYANVDYIAHQETSYKKSSGLPGQIKQGNQGYIGNAQYGRVKAHF